MRALEPCDLLVPRILLEHVLSVVRTNEIVLLSMRKESRNEAFIQVSDWLELVDVEVCARFHGFAY
jgi:hypothetical protein